MFTSFIMFNLFERNSLNRLKIKDILTHPFLIEEINDKLGCNNWYANDGNDIPCLSDASDSNDE